MLSFISATLPTSAIVLSVDKGVQLCIYLCMYEIIYRSESVCTSDSKWNSNNLSIVNKLPPVSF